MGTGKSAVGRLLARRLQRTFVDLDDRIAQAAGRSIARIFADEGETGFRKRESEAVAWVSALTSHVIATGGGVMLDDSNVHRLKESGILICLNARPDVIAKRTLGSLPARPLLSGPDPRQRIEQLLKERAPSYEKADRMIDTSDRSIQEVVEEILDES